MSAGDPVSIPLAGMGLPYEWTGVEGPRRREARPGRGPSAAGGRAARPRAPGPEARGLASALPGCRALRPPSVLGRAPLRAARPASGVPLQTPSAGLCGGAGPAKASRGDPSRPRRVRVAPAPASGCRPRGEVAPLRILRLFAGVKEGGPVPGCCSGRGRGPRRVPGSRAPPAGSSRTSAHSPRKLEP